MYLVKSEALELFAAGFKRPSYQDPYNQYDFYDYNNTDWILGGKIVSDSEVLAPEEVYKEGTWLPSLYNLQLWLVENDCVFELSYDGLVSRAKVTDHTGKEYKSKGATPTNSLFHAILNILKVYGGIPVNKNYEGTIGRVIEYCDKDK